jgi:hypothetical protein
MSRRFLKPLAFALLIALFTPNVFADACTGVVCTTRIKRLIIDTGGIWIEPVNTIAAMTCAPGSNVLIRVPKTLGNYDSLYASLLSAKLTGDSLDLRIKDNSDPCELSYLVLGN